MSPPKYMMINIVLCLMLFGVHVVVANFFPLPGSDWLNHGGDMFNRRYASKEFIISPLTAPFLRLRWKFIAGKDISATPTIYDGIIYFPCWNGNIYAIRQIDGSLVWKQNLAQLTGFNANGFTSNVNTSVARASPTIAGENVIFGIYGPAYSIALKRTTGELVWLTRLDNNFAAVVTTSGTYYNGGYYVGVSSLEETVSIEQCCIFRGSLVKLDSKTGVIIWKTYMLPDNNGNRDQYAGAAIWGSSPSIDIYRNHVYICTGNLYSAPDYILECQEQQSNQTNPNQPEKCIEPENHSNSFLALDLDNGNIKWYKQLGGLDIYIIACTNASTPNCPPQGPLPDSDFGEAPMMLTIYVNGTKKDIVVAVQKNGITWALDRDNGNITWFTQAGPGGSIGGGIWGAATDEKRVYTNIGNSENRNFKLAPSNINTTTGGWVAMDVTTGKVLWSTANPSNSTAAGPVSVANEVVFAGSTDRLGHIYAMNARTGKIIWSYETGATVYGGMSVSGGCIYVGNGYRVGLGVLFNYTAGTSLFAFCI